MIRKAERRDLPRIIEMSFMDNEKSGYSLEWNADTVEVQLRNLMLAKSGYLSVWDQGGVIGAVGGPIVTWPYNMDTLVIQEYITVGEHIDELKEDFFVWGIKNGAKAVIRLCVDESSGPRTVVFGGTNA